MLISNPPTAHTSACDVGPVDVAPLRSLPSNIGTLKVFRHSSVTSTTVMRILDTRAPALAAFLRR